LQNVTISFFLSACLSVHIKQHSPHRMRFHEI
jgi:hypothetical protein